PKELLKDPRCTLQTEEQTGFRLFHRQTPMTVYQLHRGELSKPGAEVKPQVPAAVAWSADQAPTSGNQDTTRFQGVPAGKRRAALAQWLTSPDNPLTARVLVNRVWGWHFGQALVRTPNDFGAQGDPPSHPDLLDWLAKDFIDHGWSLKHLHR